MTDLTTTHLKRLLDDGEPLTEVEHALVEEVIRLREHIEGLMTVMENKAATGSSPQDPAIIASYLKEIVLGENQ
ncbi:hypothetical protein [Corynebacterium marquesiae]|uniref:hypothetical protein n=1 Tax=Corynebacterium marquesiae TaxID=2913503 RepID=UPI0032EADB35